MYRFRFHLARFGLACFHPARFNPARFHPARFDQARFDLARFDPAPFHLALVAIAVLTGACQPSSPNDTAGQPVAADTKFFTVLARDKIQVARNASVNQVLDADGKPLGYSITARDNDSGFLACECQSACMEQVSDRCREVRVDKAAVTTISCAGGCIDSEGKSCGGCSMRVYDEPPAGGRVATGADVPGGVAPPRGQRQGY